MNWSTQISVLMTAYNRERFIGEAIDSVLTSSHPHFELIILDDASTDNTYEIALSFANRDTRIKLYRNGNNLGQFQNRNLIAQYASGRYLMYVDSDDTIKPDAIEYVITALHKYPEAEYTSITRKRDFNEATVLSSREVIHKHFLETSILHFGPGGTVISKSLFDKIRGFPLIYGPVSDMYYNIKAASNSPVLLLPYDYLNYRRHEGQAINDHYGYLYQGYRYFRDLMDLPELPLTAKQRQYLLMKAKRRFLVNSFNYLRQSCDLKKTFNAYRLAEFRLSDILQGVFNK